MSTFREISAYFGSAVQASVDDKVAVYLASMKMARAVAPAIVADNEDASATCNRSDCICMMSRPRPWTDSTDSVGLNQTLEEEGEESGSSYDDEDEEDEHDYSASLRPVNKAWNPNEEHSLRQCPSRPQTFHTAQEQIPAFWMQILPTPQPSIHEESVEGECDFIPKHIAIPIRSPRGTQQLADMKVLNDIHDPQKPQIRDVELTSVTVPLEDMTTAMFTATETPASPYTEMGDQSRRSKSSLWKRLQSQVRTGPKVPRNLDPLPLQSGWRIKIRFLAGRLLRRGT